MSNVKHSVTFEVITLTLKQGFRLSKIILLILLLQLLKIIISLAVFGMLVLSPLPTINSPYGTFIHG
jgi:hypothetical protein